MKDIERSLIGGLKLDENEKRVLSSVHHLIVEEEAEVKDEMELLEKLDEKVSSTYRLADKIEREIADLTRIVSAFEGRNVPIPKMEEISTRFKEVERMRELFFSNVKNIQGITHAFQRDQMVSKKIIGRLEDHTDILIRTVDNLRKKLEEFGKLINRVLPRNR